MKSAHYIFSRFLALTIAAGLALATTNLPAQQKSKHEQTYPVPVKLVFQLLAQPYIQKELELDEEQLPKIKTLANKYSEELKTELMKIQPLPITREEQMRENLKELEQARKERTLEIDEVYAEKLDDVLVPFQVERVGQIGIQISHGRPVFVSVFKSKVVTERANLTENQARELAKVTSQAETDYLRDLRELKARYHQQVRDTMSLEVRAAVEELLGAPYITVPEIDPDRKQEVER